MALDIYAGPLTRYFNQDWKTVGQQAAEAQGMKFVVVRPPRLFKFKERRMPKFRDRLISDLGARGCKVHPWKEEGDYFTDRLGWESQGALVIRAIYQSGVPTEPEPTVFPENAFENPFLREALKRDQSLLQLVLCETWIPSDETVVFQWQLPGRKNDSVGTTGGLLRVLHQMCDRSGLDAEYLKEAPLDQPGRENTVAEGVEYGLSIMLRVATWAHGRRMPMILDY